MTGDCHIQFQDTVRVRSPRATRLNNLCLLVCLEGIGTVCDAFKKSDLEALLTDLQELVALVEGRLPEALDDSGSAAKAPAGTKKKANLA
jgi:hypothetical protein